MLGRQDDLGDADRFAMHIFDRHLAFGVRPELTRIARTSLSFKGKILEYFVGVVDRRRHEFWCLAARVAEHNSLIARAFILVAGGIDALRDVGGLGVQKHLDLRGLPVKSILLITDILNRAARRGFYRVLAYRGAAHFAGDDDTVGCRQGLAGDPRLIGIDTSLRAFTKKKIHDFIGNPVAYLIRMAFR